MARRQLHFGVSATPSGLHKGAWRLPGSAGVDDFPGVPSLLHLARTAERGRFDAFFLADAVALDRGRMATAAPFATLEPLVLLGAISQATSRLGLVATASTTFSQPYTLARQLATLDHVSSGRAGWNIVTSSTGADNYGGAPLPSHTERYRRAAEFTEVVQQLLDSWDRDAVIGDRESGRFVDPDRVRPIEHRGEFYRVVGPLNVPRPPQGRIVLFQAGSSQEGQDLAAQHADAVFTAQQGVESALRFRRELDARARLRGRDPQTIRILPGLVPVIGATESEARARHRRLLDLADDIGGRHILSGQLNGARIDDLDLDSPVPVERLSEPDAVEGRRSRYALYYELAVHRRYSVRDLLAVELSSNGHWSMVGSPEQIAAGIAEAFESGAVDGFNVMPPTLPEGFELFVDHVVPILQRRGLFREEYAGTTLREHLDLA